MKNKGLWLLLGFSMMILGFSSLAMQMIGIHWAFLIFLEWGGMLMAVILKILLAIVGILIIVFARTDWERERRECEE